jgi:hypothetical protein
MIDKTAVGDATPVITNTTAEAAEVLSGHEREE